MKKQINNIVIEYDNDLINKEKEVIEFALHKCSGRTCNHIRVWLNKSGDLKSKFLKNL